MRVISNAVGCAVRTMVPILIATRDAHGAPYDPSFIFWVTVTTLSMLACEDEIM
jgi:hypothetical protein